MPLLRIHRDGQYTPTRNCLNESIMRMCIKELLGEHMENYLDETPRERKMQHGG